MHELTLTQANRIIEAALTRARAMNLPPLSVAVLDSGGHVKALQREDGQSFLRGVMTGLLSLKLQSLPVIFNRSALKDISFKGASDVSCRPQFPSYVVEASENADYLDHQAKR